VTVHTEKEIRLKRANRADGTCVAVITEPEDKTYRISFLSGGV
jgi:hypothetical protein